MMRILPVSVSIVLGSCGLLAQSFTVASVKPSARPLGKDANMQLTIGAAGVSGKNLTLKQLIVEAYDLRPYQVSGGPKWIDSDEYDVDAKADGLESKEQLRRMVRNLLIDRFRLAIHPEAKELSVYELVVDKNGPKVPKPAESGHRRFHGDMGQLANLLSVQLSIPPVDDPSRPSFATGSPVPVVDKTGLTEIYDFEADLRPEAGGDMFTLWQRVLQDQLGIKLEKRKSAVAIFVVDRAERIPTAN